MASTIDDKNTDNDVLNKLNLAFDFDLDDLDKLANNPEENNENETINEDVCKNFDNNKITENNKNEEKKRKRMTNDKKVNKKSQKKY